MTHVPENAAALRALPAEDVRTIRSDTDSFPGIVVKNSGGEAIVYDLTYSPPVRRTFYRQVHVAKGSAWQHASFIQSHRDIEIESILTFWRVVVKP
jgi:hypothetical protein